MTWCLALPQASPELESLWCSCSFRWGSSPTKEVETRQSFSNLCPNPGSVLFHRVNWNSFSFSSPLLFSPPLPSPLPISSSPYFPSWLSPPLSSSPSSLLPSPPFPILPFLFCFFTALQTEPMAHSCKARDPQTYFLYLEKKTFLETRSC